MWLAPGTSSSTWAPTPYKLGAPGNIFQWSPWVRAQVFNNILIAPIDVVQSEDGLVNLWVRDPIAAPAKFDDPIGYDNPRRLLSMARPNAALFKDQLKWVEYWSALRSERMAEILLETSNILLPMASVVDINPARRPHTIELLEAYYTTVAAVEMRFKNAMACRRPVEYSAQVQPMIQTPGHSSFPSGHATESFSFAFLLATLAEYRSGAGHGTKASAETADQLAAHAYRTTQNRVVAGVHFPVDNAAGEALGLRVGMYLVDRFQRAAGETPTNPLPGTPEKIEFPHLRGFRLQRVLEGQLVPCRRDARARGRRGRPGRLRRRRDAGRALAARRPGMESAMTTKATGDETPWEAGPKLPPGMEPLRYWFEEEQQADGDTIYVAPFLLEADSLEEMQGLLREVRAFVGDDPRWSIPHFYEEMYFTEEGQKHFTGPFEMVFFGPLGDAARSLISRLEKMTASGIPIPIPTPKRNANREPPDFDVSPPRDGRIERIVGIIDSDIAFANARFRNSDGTTRLAGFFDMDAIGYDLPGVPGRYVSANEINGYLGRLKTPNYTESQLYRDYQQESYLKPWMARPSPFAGHGTGVMDAAVGGDVLSDDGRTRVVAVQLPRFAVALTHGYHLDLFVRIALHVIAFVAFKAWIANGGHYPQTCVNISVGGHAGRHDGLSRAEQSMDGWLRSGLIAGIFLPAGNSFGRDVHAAFKGNELGSDQDTLLWHILPDDGTASFLEIWLPDNRNDLVGLHLTMPTGAAADFKPADLFEGAHYVYRIGGRVAARLIVKDDPAFDEAGQNRSRRCIKLMLARTALRPPIFGNPTPGFIDLAGDVAVRLTRGAIGDDELVELWIARDDQIFRLPTRARQSHFAAYSPAEKRITNTGTLSDMGTGLRTVVCAAHWASNRLPTPYSGRGIPEDRTPARRNIKPTASYVADLSEAHQGTLVAGYFSGSTSLWSGTSFSAPQVLRTVLMSPPAAGQTMKEKVRLAAENAEANGTEIRVPILPRHDNSTVDWGAGRMDYEHLGLNDTGSTDYPRRRRDSI